MYSTAFYELLPTSSSDSIVKQLMHHEGSWEVVYALCSVFVSLYILLPTLLIFLGVKQETVLQCSET